jgi:hypothetical protein
VTQIAIPTLTSVPAQTTALHLQLLATAREHASDPASREQDLTSTGAIAASLRDWTTGAST